MTKVANLKNWIEALRSGKYQQSRGSLFGGGCASLARTLPKSKLAEKVHSYCCIGVARMCLPEKLNIPNNGIDDTVCVYQAILGEFGAGYYEHDLVQMNDELGQDFEAIATFIETTILPQVVTEENCELSDALMAGEFNGG